MPSAPQCDEGVLFISALSIAGDYRHSLPLNECWPIIPGLLLHQDQDGPATFSRCGAFEVGNYDGFKFDDEENPQGSRDDRETRHNADVDRLNVHFSRVEEHKAV